MCVHIWLIYVGESIPNLSCQSTLPPATSQDPEGALLESGDLIPEQMSRLLPEVGDDKTPEEEAQPGTGASFRFPNCINIYIYVYIIIV